ncbi:MAG: signal peptide peptidase SppA [Porticoccaceae bacterium]
MASQNPSIIRRIFSFIGKFFKAIRTIIGIVFTGLLIIAIVGMFGDHLPPIPEKGALYLAPTGILVDQQSYVYPIDTLLADQAMTNPETLVRDVIDAINTAAVDDRITHLIIATDYLEAGGIAKLDEISNALINFKATEKPIIAVADNFNQSQYYLAAHADHILLNPMGSVLINGFGAYGNYFADALEKLKIKVNVFRAGEYKSAAEPFIRNDMSPQAREERTDVVDRLWQTYTSKIEDLRQLDQGSINALANNLGSKLQGVDGDTALLAYQEGLVDQLASRSEIYSYLNQQIPNDIDGKYNSVDMAVYLAHIDREQSQALPAMDKVAVIVAKGTILDGQQPEGNVGADTMAQILSDLRYDQDIKAIVLRVDSPGGSAFASDVIRDALYHSDLNLPVVVSMGSYAASGGYWIAAEADKILALSTTITGSIGVYSMIPTVDESLAALGIYSDGVGTSDIAGIMQLDRPMSDQAKVILHSSVEHLYSKFINLVAEGRETPAENIEKIARGRIWTGQQALEMGLVDELGGLNNAIDAAAELAGLTHYGVFYPTRLLSPYEQFIQEFSRNISLSLNYFGFDSWLPQILGKNAQSIISPLKNLDNFNDPRGMYLHCDTCPM